MIFNHLEIESNANLFGYVYVSLITYFLKITVLPFLMVQKTRYLGEDVSMREIVFVVGSLLVLMLEKYVLANNSISWLGAIVPVVSIVFIMWLLITKQLSLDLLDILVSILYVSLSFIFWGQGNDLYHRRTVKKIAKQLYENTDSMTKRI